MPKYANFDSSLPAPQLVIGWYDTDDFNYPNLPTAVNLLLLTQAQWDNRFQTPYVQNGSLIAPVLTSAQLSAQQWATYQASAKLALITSDETVTRVSEAISLGLTTATTSDVVTFMQYRKSLRAILTQAQPTTIPTSLPTKPPYPANT